MGKKLAGIDESRHLPRLKHGCALSVRERVVPIERQSSNSVCPRCSISCFLASIRKSGPEEIFICRTRVRGWTLESEVRYTKPLIRTILHGSGHLSTFMSSTSCPMRPAGGFSSRLEQNTSNLRSSALVSVPVRSEIPSNSFVV